jgi:hypothetical protein
VEFHQLTVEKYPITINACLWFGQHNVMLCNRGKGTIHGSHLVCENRTYRFIFSKTYDVHIITTVHTFCVVCAAQPTARQTTLVDFQPYSLQLIVLTSYAVVRTYFLICS